MVRRLRDALAIAEALAAGQPPAQIKKGLRMPAFAADRLIADVGKRDVEAFRRALELMADLELESRGGGGGGLERGHRRGARGDRAPRAERARDRAAHGATRRLTARQSGAGRGAGARRGTSCARRCCGAARRA